MQAGRQPPRSPSHYNVPNIGFVSALSSTWPAPSSTAFSYAASFFGSTSAPSSSCTDHQHDNHSHTTASAERTDDNVGVAGLPLRSVHV